jgi:hypothetical protein
MNYEDYSKELIRLDEDRKRRNNMNDKNGLFIITMERKLDRKFFLSNPQHLYLDFDTAMVEATRRARDLSKDYRYIVTELIKVVAVESSDPPVKITNY